MKRMGSEDGSAGDATNSAKYIVMSVKNLDMHIKESAMSSYRDPRDWSWSEISIVIKVCRSWEMRLLRVRWCGERCNSC